MEVSTIFFNVSISVNLVELLFPLIFKLKYFIYWAGKLSISSQNNWVFSGDSVTHNSFMLSFWCSLKLFLPFVLNLPKKTLSLNPPPHYKLYLTQSAAGFCWRFGGEITLLCTTADYIKLHIWISFLESFPGCFKKL